MGGFWSERIEWRGRDLRPWLALWLVTFAVGAAMTVRSCILTRAHSERIASQFLQTCEARRAKSECVVLVRSHHDECFSVTNHPRSRFSPPHFDAQGYDECIMLGKDGWLENRRARRQAGVREARELGIPPELLPLSPSP